LNNGGCNIRYFICPLSKVYVGIPAEQTERIIQVTRAQTAVYETENRQTFISLPALLRLNDTFDPHGADLHGVAPHGVVLKTRTSGDPETVLLTPKVDIDLEIPEESIHRLPESFSGLFRYFRGACFNGQNMILILNPEKLTRGLAEGVAEESTFNEAKSVTGGTL